MARTAELFRPSDVTRWGIVALVSLSLAVLSANVSALLPPATLSGLHATRLGGLSVEQLRTTVANLRQEAVAMQRENSELAARFSLNEEAGHEATRRIGALEATLPHLLETLAANEPGVDRSLTTASIGAPEGETRDADGGKVRVVQTPMQMPSVLAPEPAPARAGTAAFTPNSEGRFGMAVGPRLTPGQAAVAWDDLSRTLGATILGFTPLLADEAGGTTQRIVLGPAADLAEATAVCGRLERASVPCEPMPYAGTPLAP
ncbi:hypothetical protein [Devosia nitrariae]|uniref:SPOR domain-containing protein n=1 Tax=Devosia nitrariae TaxID=2071872 RepID=A0ABQ5WCN2_9HYPH|nr:hypothetical protein [Devosia nitrariae]GLQ57633.1 hypothetical protein GCM10010862_48920 [Devosia nitrariae]